MPQQNYHLAQINIARMRYPLDDPSMAEFVARLDEVNALADGSPGFIWRLQTAEGNATSVRAYDDDMLIVNMSVWRSAEELKEYVYRGDHAAVMRRRREWFEKFDGMYYTLWWVDAGHIPTVEEARQRLEHIREHGETEYAFSYRHLFPAPGSEATWRRPAPVACQAWGAGA